MMEPSVPGSPSPEAPRRSSVTRKIFSRPVVKLALIGAVLLLMFIPLSLVSGVIKERQERQAEVLKEFKSSWGPEQSVAGPILVVPYRDASYQQMHYLHIAPTKLAATIHVAPEVRKRGIFHAIVYRAAVELTGNFQVPSDALPGNGAEILWQQSIVLLRADDLRAATSTASLRLNDQPVAWADCGTDDNVPCERDLLSASAGLAAAPAAGASISFAVGAELRGTEAIWMVPIGRDVQVAISGPWSTPSFGGAMLPDDTAVTARDFEASWHASGNGTAGRWTWSSNAIDDAALGSTDARLGVTLLEPVPTYQMVERSAKYALLFLALSFLTYFLFEVLSGTRIHIVQYGLLGLSISLFALLLISFSEPLGFTAGYAIAALMVLLQASLYTAAVTRERRQAMIFAGILASLFGFLYVVLSLESYSLLVGSVAVFAALSVAMAATRKVDWSKGWTRVQA